jgi:hypothetical protein
MKFDEFGVVIGLEDIEHTKGMFESPDTNDFFTKLKQNLPWSQLSWSEGRTYHRFVFNYGEIERSYNKYDILEELILLVEETYETDIIELWCDYFPNGDNHTIYNQKNYNKNTIILTFGGPRKLLMRDKTTKKGKKITLDSGDMFYTSKKVNCDYEFSIPKNSKTKSNETIIVTFLADCPYKNREQHIRNINVLGIGNIPVFFQGRTSEFPEDTIAVILPNSFLQMLEGIQRPIIEDTGSPIEVTYEYN